MIIHKKKKSTFLKIAKNIPSRSPLLTGVKSHQTLPEINRKSRLSVEKTHFIIANFQRKERKKMVM